MFDRGERPDYEVVLAVIDYFKDYPDPAITRRRDMIVEKAQSARSCRNGDHRRS